MPISDEIIELTPVKKTKSTLIIMFAVMGVLLAAAVTFLVLYFLKPNVQENTGAVKDITVEQSEMFAVLDESGKSEYYVSVGNEYTVYATVAFEGDKTNAVRWVCDSAQIEKTSEGIYKDPADAEADATPSETVQGVKYYFSFKPRAEAAGQTVSISAVSASDSNINKTITFKIKKQGTESVELRGYRSEKATALTEMPADGVIKIPYYHTSTSKNNETYIVLFDQRGAYSVTTGGYAPITVIPKYRDDKDSNVMTAESSNTNAVTISNTRTGRIEFSAKGPGSATITITANTNNDFAEPVSVSFQVLVQSNEDLGFINRIMVYDAPVGVDYFRTYLSASRDPSRVNTLPASVKSLTLSPTVQFDILPYIAVNPFSVQYDEKEEKMRESALSDLCSRLTITSSNKNVVNPEKGSDKSSYILRVANTQSGIVDKCTITITDTMPNALGTSITIDVYVAANHSKNTLTVTQGAGRPISSDTDITGVASSPDVTVSIDVAYSFTASSSLKPEDFFAAGLFTNAYMITTSAPDCMTIKLGNKTIVPGNVYSFNEEEFNITQQTAGKNIFTGTATFAVTFASQDVLSNGNYTFTFTSIAPGTEKARAYRTTVLSTPNTADDLLPDTYRIVGPASAVNTEVVNNVTFAISAIATHAYFIGEDESTEASNAAGTALITQKGYAGSFNIVESSKNADGSWKKRGEAVLYVQNRREGVKLTEIIDVKKLITTNVGSDEAMFGEIKVELKDLGLMFNGAFDDSYDTVVFKGASLSSDSSLEFQIKAVNNAGDELGIFKIKIYVIDAIKALNVRDYDLKSKPVYYSGTALQTIHPETVEAVYEQSSSRPIYNNYTVKLAYKYGTEYFELQRSENDFLAPDGVTPLFSVGSGNTISLATDIFVYGYSLESKIDFSNIRVTYVVNENDDYKTDNGEPPSVYVDYNLVRYADDIGLYTSESYSAASAVGKVVGSNTEFKYDVNEDVISSLFISPEVIINDTPVAINGLEAMWRNVVEFVFMSVPETSPIKPTQAVSDGKYTYFSFRAPKVPNSAQDGVVEYQIVISGQRSESNRLLRVFISNKICKIEDVKYYIYDDAKGETPESYTSDAKSITFGRYRALKNGENVDDFYNKNIFVVIKYEAWDSSYVQFESATLKATKGMEFYIDSNAESQVTIGKEYINNGADNADGEQYLYGRMLNIRVVQGVAKTGTGEISTVTANYTNGYKLECPIGTGIDFIGYKYSYKDQSGKDITKYGEINVDSSSVTTTDLGNTIYFKLQDLRSTANDVHIYLHYHSFAVDDGYAEHNDDVWSQFEEKYDLRDPNTQVITEEGMSDDGEGNHGGSWVKSGIAYTSKNLSSKVTDFDGHVQSNDSKFGGIRYTAHNVDRYVDIGIDSDNITARSNRQITVVFSDNSPAPADGPNVFTVKFYITVEVGLYDLAPETEKLAFVTSGKLDNSETSAQSITVNVNVANLSVQPVQADLDKVQAIVYYGNDPKEQVNSPIKLGSLVYNAGKITVSATVLNSLVTSKDGGAEKYSVRFKYGDTVYGNIPVVVTTDATAIKLKDTNIAMIESKVENTVTLSGVAASVAVPTSGSVISLPVVKYNIGTQSVISGASGVSYAVYDSAENRNSNSATKSIIAEVNNGNVTFAEAAYGDVPSSGTLYYRATYTDSSSGIRYYIDIDLPFTVDINTIELKNNNNAVSSVTLYYVENGGYTYFDVSKFISGRSSAFTGVTMNSAALGGKYTIEAQNGATSVTVDGTQIRPVSAATGVKVRIAYSDQVYCDLTVNVVKLDLALSSDKTTLDVSLDNDSLDLNASNNDANDDLALSYTLTGPDKFTVANNKTITVKQNSFTTASDFKSYAFTATVNYAPKSGVLFDVQGTLAVAKTFDVTAEWNYVPEFKITSGTDDVATGGNLEADGGTYKIKVTNTENHSGMTYSVTTSPAGIIDNITENSTGDFAVSFTKQKYGNVEIYVTAARNGKSANSVAQSYTVTDGTTISAMFANTSNEKLSVTESKYNDVAIDYTTSAPSYRYVIDATNVGTTLTVNDIEVELNGNDITAVGAVTAITSNKFYVQFTVNKPTKLSAHAAVTVNGRTYSLSVDNIEFTATAPSFALSADKTSIYVDQTAKFGVSQTATGFQGGYSVAYSIVGGGDYADIDASSGVLTPIKNNETDQRVVVKATVTVSNGVYAGTYTLEKDITINGVPLPTFKWTDSVRSRKVEVGGSTSALNVAGAYSVGNVTVGTSNVSFTASAFKYTLVAPSGFTTSDYTFDNATGVLGINDTAKTRSGGKFYITAQATLSQTNGILTGKTVSTVDSIEVIITPRAQIKDNNRTVYVSGQKSTYDIGYAVKPYMEGNYSVTYKFVAGSELVNVNGNYTVSGSLLKLKEDVTSAIDLTLKAYVTMTSGDYAGISSTKVIENMPEITVKVCGFTADNNNAFIWQTGETKGYNTIDVSTLVPSTVTGVTNINIVSVDQVSFVHIADNDTASPKISIDKNTNVVGGTNQLSSIKIIYIVTADGHDYYAESTLGIAQISPVIDFEVSAGNEIKDASDQFSKISMESGGSASVMFTESHGLPMIVSINNFEDLPSYLKATVSGSVLSFRASPVDEDKNYSVSVNVSVAGATGIAYTFPIDILKPSEEAYVADNTTFAVTKSPTSQTLSVTSTWTPVSSAYSGSQLQISSTNSNYAIEKVLVYYSGSATGTSVTASYGGRYYLSNNPVSKIEITTNYQLNPSRTTSYSYNWTLRTINNGQTVTTTIPYNITLSDSVNVSFNLNGGNINGNSSVAPVTLSYGETLTLDGFDSPQKTGYVYGGWYEDPEFTKPFTNKFGTMVNRSYTLYLKWTPISDITVRYSGVDAIADKTGLTFNQPYGELATPTKTGYTFDGWYSDNNTYTNRITSASIVDTTGTDKVITLYAKWTAIQYTVTYVPNNGSAVTSLKIAYGGDYSGAPTSLALEGHKLEGWYTSYNFASGTKINIGTDKVTGAATLYAKWIKEAYKVTFDYAGGSLAAGSAAAQAYEYGATTLPAATKNGYTFAGWKVATTDMVIMPGESVPDLGDGDNDTAYTLTAQWTANTYTVILDPNGGELNEGAANTVTVTYESNYPAISNPATRTGYTFVGWFTDKTGGTQVTAETTVRIADAHVLYAQWTINNLTVTFDVNGGDAWTGNNGTATVEYGGSVTPLPTPTRSGNYAFVGWYTEQGGGNKVESITNVTEDKIYYAHWVQTHTVTFNANNGQFENAAIATKIVTVENGSGCEMPLPTRTGYDFVGWYTAEIGGSFVLNVANITDDVTYYAHWTVKTYTVRFDLNEGEGPAPNDITVTYGSTFGAGTGDDAFPTDPTRTGYNFDGWYTEQTGGTQVNGTTTVGDLGENYTLYAHWTQSAVTEP